MPRPQLTDQAVETTRAKLTDIALALYLSEGLEAISFRRLADMAGISHTLPYRYFDSKEALLIAVRVACTQRFERFVRSRERSGANAIEQARHVAAAYVDFVKSHPGEYQMIFTTHQPPPDQYPELLAARRSLFEHAVDIVRVMVESGQLQGNPREIAHVFWISLHGLMTLHVGGQLVHGLQLEQLVGPLVDRMLAGAADGPGTLPQKKSAGAAARPRKSTR